MSTVSTFIVQITIVETPYFGRWLPPILSKPLLLSLLILIVVLEGRVRVLGKTVPLLWLCQMLKSKKKKKCNPIILSQYVSPWMPFQRQPVISGTCRPLLSLELSMFYFLCEASGTHLVECHYRRGALLFLLLLTAACTSLCCHPVDSSWTVWQCLALSNFVEERRNWVLYCLRIGGAVCHLY